MHRLTATFSLLLLAGCAADVPLGKPGITEPEILAQAESLRAGNREEVHAALGEPLIAAPDTSAEVFRVSSEQPQVLLVLTPLPFPIPAPSLVSDGYTLVTYDRSGAVCGIDAGFRRSDDASAGGLLLRAGDYEFLHGRADALLVSLERYLVDLAEAPPDEACTVLVGCEQECGNGPFGDAACGGGVCWSHLQVDGGAVRELPLYREAVWRRTDIDAAGNAVSEMAPVAAERCLELGGNASGCCCILKRWPLVPVRLTPGRHTFVATTRSKAGEARGEIECAAGELVFAALGGRLVEEYGTMRQLLLERFHTGVADGRVTFSVEVPAGMAGRRVLVRP